MGSKEDEALLRALKKESPSGTASVSLVKVFLVALGLAPLIYLEHYLVGKGTYFTGILLTVYICAHVFDVKVQNATNASAGKGLPSLHEENDLSEQLTPKGNRTPSADVHPRFKKIGSRISVTWN